MKINLKKITMLIAMIGIHASYATPVARLLNFEVVKIDVLELSPSEFLNQAALLAMRGTQTAGLVNDRASSEALKNYAKLIVSNQGKINELLSNLAKSKGVVLPLSKPQGGQRPDGRVDSAPDNLGDTSRNQNPGAQAGNSGLNSGTLKEKDVLQSVDALKQLKGSAFDRAYADRAISDLNAAIALYKTAAQSKDKAIKTHAVKYLPVLQSNLTKVQAIEARL